VSSSGCGIIGVASILHAGLNGRSGMIQGMASIVVRPEHAATGLARTRAANGLARMA